MKTVILKNGAEEAETLVGTTMMSLEDLLGHNPIAFYEWVMLCRDRDHRPFGDTKDALRRLSLVQSDGQVHDSIQNIVLSAVTGDGVGMVLGSPLK